MGAVFCRPSEPQYFSYASPVNNCSATCCPQGGNCSRFASIRTFITSDGCQRRSFLGRRDPLDEYVTARRQRSKCRPTRPHRSYPTSALDIARSSQKICSAACERRIPGRNSTHTHVELTKHPGNASGTNYSPNDAGESSTRRFSLVNRTRNISCTHRRAR